MTSNDGRFLAQGRSLNSVACGLVSDESLRAGGDTVICGQCVLTFYRLTLYTPYSISVLMADASNFTHPSGDWRRRYNALRASFVERLPAHIVAERFGYTTGYIHLLRHQFKHGKLDFAETRRPRRFGSAPTMFGAETRRKICSLARTQAVRRRDPPDCEGVDLSGEPWSVSWRRKVLQRFAAADDRVPAKERIFRRLGADTSAPSRTLGRQLGQDPDLPVVLELMAQEVDIASGVTESLGNDVRQQTLDEGRAGLHGVSPVATRME